MTTPTRKLSPEARRILKGRQRHRWLRYTMISGLVIAALGALYLPPTQQAETATASADQAIQQRTVIADKATQAADPLLALCAGTDDVARRLQAARTKDGTPLCAQAADVKVEAAQVAPTTIVTQKTDPATVYAAVVQYCAQHDGCRGPDGQTPDFDAIVAAVTARIPTPANGADGKNAPAVTGAQIFQQVQTYCSMDSDPCRGAAGKKGDTGDTGQAGQKGDTGDPGRGVVSFEPVQDYQGQAGCWMVTTYTDNTETAFEVNAVMCTP